MLYIIFSMVAIVLASMLIWIFWKNIHMSPMEWMAGVKTPIFIVKNDVTFFAILAPLSLALTYHKPLSLIGFIGILSIFLSVIVLGIFQSRVALITMFISVSCFFTFIRPKVGLISGLVVFILVLLIDSILGSPLIERFIYYWDGTGRIPLWLSALKMSLDAPLLGHGPHTFMLFYNSYLSTLSLPSWLYIDPRLIPWPHNLYLEVLGEQGLIGLTTFIMLLTYGFIVSWKIRKAKSKELRILDYGAFAGLMGFCLAAMIELTFLRLWVVILLFILLGIISHLLDCQKEE